MKRKRGEPRRRRLWWILGGIAALYVVAAIGVTTLIGVGGWGLWFWTVSRPTPTALPPTPSPVPIVIYHPYPTTMPSATPAGDFTTSLPASIVFSNPDGLLGTIYDGGQTYYARPNGQNIPLEYVAAAPNGKYLAYLHLGRLHILTLGGANGEDQVVALAGIVRSARWSPDSTSLALLVRSSEADLIYRLDVKSLEPFYLLTAPSFAAPPVWHPATDRMLIAEPAGQNQTVLYTIDAGCISSNDCAASREEFTTLAYPVSWLDYQPNGIGILAADRDNGRLYYIGTAQRDSTLLFNDGVFKRTPLFSPDGQRIAYLDNSSHLYVANLRDQTTAQLRTMNTGNLMAQSFSWDQQ